jgi:hypothetical protein
MKEIFTCAWRVIVILDTTVYYNIEIQQPSAYNVPSKVALTLFDLPKHVAGAKFL